MSCEPVIRAANVSKHYLIYENPADRLKQMIAPRLFDPFRKEKLKFYREFTAVDDVSFEVARGETVGIVGRNGSGKSTLLQLVCGTLQPTHGDIEVRGRIAALLELGSGFNPDFTGRENVFLNASILGLSRPEIEARFDNIVEFSGIREFIDQPVKTYSSGMYVRLAFSVATNVDPDILIVDEALSVGDEAFQRKCFARIEQIKDRGGTILFVSHGAQTVVQLCDRALLLDRGQSILLAEPNLVVKQYQRLMNLSGREAEVARQEIISLGESINHLSDDTDSDPQDVEMTEESRLEFASNDELAWFDEALKNETRIEYESNGARLSNVRIETTGGRKVNCLKFGERYCVRYEVEITHPQGGLICGAQFKTLEGFIIAGVNNKSSSSVPRLKVNAGKKLDVSIEFDCVLLPGTYAIDVGLMGNDNFAHRILDALLFRIMDEDDLLSTGYLDLRPSMSMVDRSDIENSKSTGTHSI